MGAVLQMKSLKRADWSSAIDERREEMGAVLKIKSLKRAIGSSATDEIFEESRWEQCYR